MSFFGTIIDFEKDGNIFINEKRIALVPKLFEVYKQKGLGSKAVKWIVAMYDLESPYRKFPMELRTEMVSSAILEKQHCSFEKNKLVVEAIEEYVKLNYDPLIHEYQSMVNKSYEILQVYKDLKITKDNIKDANDMQKSIGDAAKSRGNIRDMIIKQQENKAKISGMNEDDNLSIFENELT